VLAHMNPRRRAVLGLGERPSGRPARHHGPDSPEVSEIRPARARSGSSAGGVQALVDIINRSDRGTERLILEGLEQDNPELADEVRSRMFVFEDIVALDDRSVQLVLRQVDSKDLAIALKGVPTQVRDKILQNMSERARQNLVEEIDLLGPIRLQTVEESQGAVVRVIRALEESGQILISRSNDEFVV
jgi:flagellar motor switch protein FliG